MVADLVVIDLQCVRRAYDDRLLKGWVQNYANWRFGWKKLLRKGMNFSMWASFRLRNTALKFFSMGCSFFSRINVCKKLGFPWPRLCLHMFVEQKQANCFQCTKSKSNPRAYRSGDLRTDCLHRLLWRETHCSNRSTVKWNTIEEKEMWCVRVLQLIS